MSPVARFPFLARRIHGTLDIMNLAFSNRRFREAETMPGADHLIRRGRFDLPETGEVD